MTIQSDFETAIHAPWHRDEFVKRLAAHHGCQYLQGATYCEGYPQEATNVGVVPTMGILIETDRLSEVAHGTRGIKSVLNVYPSLFEYGATIDTALWFLDHEAQHAEDIATGVFPDKRDAAFRRVESIYRTAESYVRKERADNALAALGAWYGLHLEARAYDTMLRNPFCRNIPRAEIVHKMGIHKYTLIELERFNRYFENMRHDA